MAKKKKTDAEQQAPEARPVSEQEPAPRAVTDRQSEPAAAAASAPVPVARPAPVADGQVALAADISLEASANAPFIYFENAGVSGHMNGMIRVTLEANRVLPGENNKVFVDRVIVAHLRMNIPAAQSLRNAIDRALLIASKPATDKLN